MTAPYEWYLPANPFFPQAWFPMAPYRAPVRVTAYDTEWNKLGACPSDNAYRSDVLSRHETLFDLPALRECNPGPPCPLQRKAT